MHRYCLLKAVGLIGVVAEQGLSQRGLGMMKDQHSWVCSCTSWRSTGWGFMSLQRRGAGLVAPNRIVWSSQHQAHILGSTLMYSRAHILESTLMYSRSSHIILPFWGVSPKTILVPEITIFELTSSPQLFAARSWLSLHHSSSAIVMGRW